MRCCMPFEKLKGDYSIAQAETHAISTDLDFCVQLPAQVPRLQVLCPVLRSIMCPVLRFYPSYHVN